MNSWISRTDTFTRKSNGPADPERGRTRIVSAVLNRKIQDRNVNWKGNSMRTRSRTKLTNITGLRNQIYTRTYFSGSPPPFKQVVLQKVTMSITEKSEVITDSIVARPEVYVDPVTLKWRRIRYPSSKYLFDISGSARLFGKNRSFRPVQPCTHVKSVVDQLDLSRELSIAATGNPTSSWSNEYSLTYANPYLCLPQLVGFSGDPASLFSSTIQNHTSSAYREIDWYALAESFENSCESFTKAKFLAGESLYECGIFVDAFKILLNPASALQVLVKNIHKYSSPHQVGKFRRMKLGQFAKSCKGLTKTAVNAHLSYDFAVKPAIEDVKATLNAHHFVSQRMKFLQNHGGSWVPIRVRQKLDADYVNVPPDVLNVGQASQTYTHIAEKSTVGVISAWGRVREDLDWENTWSAYLQYFGVDRLVGLAWELIPFSFVIDWVTNSQEHINSLTRLRTGGPFGSIRGLSASVKKSTRLNLLLNPGYISSLQAKITNPSDPIVLGSKTQTDYSRFTTIPTTSGFVDFSSLGSFRYTKLAELVFQFFVK
jgi:hypothetical protein